MPQGWGRGLTGLKVLGLALAAFAASPAGAAETGLVMPGFSTGAAVQSYLRFSNSDGLAHNVTVMLHSAVTGEMLGAWTSPPVPIGGTYEASLAEMIAGSDPPIPAERLPRSLVLVISGLTGHVQHAARTEASGAWSNLSSCGMAMMADPLSLPYVSGPARDDISGFVRVTNGTDAPRSLRIYLNDNAGAVSAWDSPVIAATAASVFSMAEVMAQASPPVAATARSLMVMADAAPFGIALSYMEGIKGSGTFADFSAACMLAIPAPPPVGVGAGTGGMPDMTGMPGHPE